MLASVRLRRRGATLPLTVIVLALMAVAVAITYGRISAERHIGSDSRARLGAFAVAQTALNRYLAGRNAKPGWSQDTSFTDLAGGTAQVSLRMIRESTTTLLPAVYAITARGVNTDAKRFDSRAPAAERTVGTYALWTPTPLDLNGAFTSLGQVAYNGSSATISGVDRCGAGANIPGLAVPNADVSQFTQSPPNVIDGTPDNAASNLGTPGAGGTAKGNVQIDWAGILAGTAFPADRVYPAQTWLPMTGTPSMADWPVTRVNGDLTMPGSGKGILIVTGNLTWNGTPLKTWEGLILIGGSITANGNANIYGALVSGLNLKTGGTIGLNDIGNGTKTYQYDSCSLARALGHIGSIQRVRNGWTDTWSSY